MLKEGDDYFWYLTDGGIMYVYDDETSYEDFVFPRNCIRRVEKKIASDNGDEVSLVKRFGILQSERHTVDALTNMEAA